MLGDAGPRPSRRRLQSRAPPRVVAIAGSCTGGTAQPHGRMARLSLRLVFVATSSWPSSVSSNPRFLLRTGEIGSREMAQGRGIDVVVSSSSSSSATMRSTWGVGRSSSATRPPSLLTLLRSPARRRSTAAKAAAHTRGRCTARPARRHIHPHCPRPDQKIDEEELSKARRGRDQFVPDKVQTGSVRL